MSASIWNPGTPIGVNADSIGFEPYGAATFPVGTVAWWLQNLNVSVLRYIPPNLRAEIIAGTNTVDLTAYIQEALDDQLLFGWNLTGDGYIYKCNSGLDWRRSSADQAETMVLTDIKFDFSGLTGAEVGLRVGATEIGLFFEGGYGKIALQRVFAIGPESVDPRTEANPTTTVGISMEFAGNVTIDTISFLGFFKNYYSKFVFPVTGINCNFRRGWISMHFDEASNRQTWIEVNAVNSRYGVLIRSESTVLDGGKSNTITFQGLWTEGASVPVHIDTDAGVPGIGAVRHRGIKFLSSYLSSPASAVNQYDFFRIGIRWTLGTPSVRGADCTEFISDLLIDTSGGLVNPTAGAWSATQAFCVFDSSNTRCRNFQLNSIITSDRLDTNTFVNNPLAGWARTSGYPGITDGIVEEVWWNSGAVVRRLMPDGSVWVGPKTTAATISEVGVETKPDGSVWATASSTPVLRLNRKTTSGTAVALYFDNNLVGGLNVTAAGLNLTLDAALNILLVHGAGTPEGVVTAGVGSLFLRNDGGATTTLYVKTSGTGNTGWTAK